MDGNISANQTNFKVRFLSENGVTPTIECAPDNTVSVDGDVVVSDENWDCTINSTDDASCGAGSDD